jgi:hypothetical protein
MIHSAAQAEAKLGKWAGERENAAYRKKATKVNKSIPRLRKRLKEQNSSNGRIALARRNSLHSSHRIGTAQKNVIELTLRI